MTPDPNTATINQCRDWIAENVLGWTPPGSFSYHRHEWERDNENQGTDKLDEGVHPMGTDKGTDAAISAMPKGWYPRFTSELDGSWFGIGRPYPDVRPWVEARGEKLSECAWRLCLAMHIAEGRGK